uniref:DSN1 component of MIS12 kinetochore complex n=1 Tax=Otolemur garnettii TaxID=30611 RepID=H0WHF6_OTOGA
MTSVTRSEIMEEQPVMSKTHDHQVESSLSSVEVCTKSSANPEMTQGVSKERICLDSSLTKGESCDPSHQEGLQSRSLHLSPQEQSTHQDRRQSWRRASMKGTNRRKSLHPIHQGITELSRSISLNLAESKRLGSLLLSSFQFSVQKLEPFLRDSKGFSVESFRAKVSSLSEELKHFADRLESDGTLQKCFEDSNRNEKYFSLTCNIVSLNEESKNKYLVNNKNYGLAWAHQTTMMDQILARNSTTKCSTETRMESVTYNGSSQSEILNTKPDYQKILQNQNRVFDYMELVMDELQGSVKQLQAFMDESTQCFQKVSAQLGKRSVQQLDPSPARKLLKLHFQNLPTTHGSGSGQ